MKKALIFLILLLCHQTTSLASSPFPKRLSENPRVARMSIGPFKKGACTASLIGRTCMVSAGHCQKNLFFAEFNTPRGTKYAGPREASQRDKYKVDRTSIVKSFDGAGSEDWAVFRLAKHNGLNRFKLWWMELFQNKIKMLKYTRHKQGYYAGDIQGHYRVSNKKIEKSMPIELTGYGVDEKNIQSQVQHTAMGQVKIVSPWFSKTNFYHDADINVGDSGASVIDTLSGKLIGVHSYYECYKDFDSTNSCVGGGTGVSLTTKFRKAIETCLDWESSNLPSSSR